jgi:hypothetical protein
MVLGNRTFIIPSPRKGKEPEPKPHTLYNFNSKNIMHLSVKYKTPKILEKSIGKNLCDLGLDKSILRVDIKNTIPKRKI